MTTKLNNPTDKELEEAFAEVVAGWTRVHLGGSDYVWKHPRPSDGELSIYPLEPFTTSFDAVLPWLDKTGRWEADYIADVGPNGQAYALRVRPQTDKSFAPTLARAAVLALLAAHGVEVIFTPTGPDLYRQGITPGWQRDCSPRGAPDL